MASINKSYHSRKYLKGKPKRISEEVMDRLLGNYDNHRRICSTYHKGIQRPPKSYKKSPPPPLSPFLNEKALSERKPILVDA
jgi:hypothetical protein